MPSLLAEETPAVAGNSGSYPAVARSAVPACHAGDLNERFGCVAGKVCY
jgi:hypothetical protein